MNKAGVESCLSLFSDAKTGKYRVQQFLVVDPPGGGSQDLQTVPQNRTGQGDLIFAPAGNQRGCFLHMLAKFGENIAMPFRNNCLLISALCIA